MAEKWAFVGRYGAHSLYLDTHCVWFYSHADFGDVIVKLDKELDAKLIVKILTSVLLAEGNLNLGKVNDD